MEKKRAHVWIEGRVQGVYFRAYTTEAATKEGVAGWVRNLPDGRVEAIFEGDSERVDRMIQWCRKGSPGSRVVDVEVKEEPFEDEFEGFRVTR